MNSKKSAYGKFSETSTIRVANSVLYGHTCQTCKGEGEVQCRKCRGKGEFRCDKCAGKGEHGCDSWGCVNGFYYQNDGKKRVVALAKEQGELGVLDVKVQDI